MAMMYSCIQVIWATLCRGLAICFSKHKSASWSGVEQNLCKLCELDFSFDPGEVDHENEKRNFGAFIQSSGANPRRNPRWDWPECFGRHDRRSVRRQQALAVWYCQKSQLLARSDRKSNWLLVHFHCPYQLPGDEWVCAVH